MDLISSIVIYCVICIGIIYFAKKYFKASPTLTVLNHTLDKVKLVEYVLILIPIIAAAFTTIWKLIIASAVIYVVKLAIDYVIANFSTIEQSAINEAGKVEQGVVNEANKIEQDIKGVFTTTTKAPVTTTTTAVPTITATTTTAPDQDPVAQVTTAAPEVTTTQSPN